MTDEDYRVLVNFAEHALLKEGGNEKRALENLLRGLQSRWRFCGK
jgi:hypothetical protein